MTLSTYESILMELGLSENKLFRLNVEHFTENEGRGRDQQVLQYFGKDGINDLVETIVNTFTASLDTTLLDLGSGSGTFLVPVVEKIKPEIVASLDATPLMLDIVKEKINQANIFGLEFHQVIGDIEQLNKTIEVNKKYNQELPTKYTNILSTLALHHVPNTEKVIQGIADTLTENGQAVVIDAILSNKSRIEPSEEHAHDGFDMKKLGKLCKKYFHKVEIKKLDIRCQESATKNGTELFLLKMEKPKKIMQNK